MAPPRLAPQLLSLPPILHKLNPNPMSGCSKAPRGLFALARVTCIFTGISISPDPSLRQRPDRYAIRAGRNLPDKEFRYLRTVIVTAAVYRGFDSKLCPIQRSLFNAKTLRRKVSIFSLCDFAPLRLKKRSMGLTSPLNLPAPGRRQTLYVVFMTLQSPVFLVNSRLSLFAATSSRYISK